MSKPPSPPPSDPEPPVLTLEMVEDDEALGEAVDEFIRRDAEASTRLAEIVQLQQAVRVAVDADVWQILLRADEAVTARWADVAVEIARWAFTEGVRSASPPREAS